MIRLALFAGDLLNCKKKSMRKLFTICVTGIALCGRVQAQSTDQATQIDAAIQELVSQQAGNGPTNAISTFINFHTKEDTKGSRYLFGDWVKGSVVNAHDVTVANAKLLFNYDKITHDLYLTADKKTVIEIDKDQVKSFKLEDGSQEYQFVRIPSIDPVAFCRLLAGPDDSSKFNLYKLTKTRFKKADYHTDGLVETGNNYDEYVDENEYYVGMPGGKEFKKVEFKKKAIKETFPAQQAKVNEYFSAHRDDNINENFLTGLIGFLNS
jgi:hypothetical protein